MKKPDPTTPVTPAEVDRAADMATTVLALPPRAIDPLTPVEVRARIVIIDAATGERIEKVTAADVDAKTLTRFAVVDGNLVRDRDGRYAMIDEERDIRIEWIAEPAA